MIMEEWRDIKGYEGYYQVSSLGNIKSLEKLVKTSRGIGLKPIREKIRSCKVDSYGYKKVTLSKENVLKTFKIHKLVAIHFLDYIPNDKKIVIDHIDGVKINNEVSNLRIVTNRENTSTCFRKNKETFSSQYVGVCWSKKTKKWMSSIRINGKVTYLGLFDDELEASNVYQQKLSTID